jgi:transposase
MEADLKTVSKRIEKDLKEQDKMLKSLMNKTFACEADALKAVADFEKTLSYHRLEQTKILAHPHYLQRCRPNSDAQPTHYSFHVQATLVQNPVVIDALRQQAGRFILATNSLDSQTWTARDILREYKAQQSTERGFRFLKDPMFFASSIFLKNTKRVMALMSYGTPFHLNKLVNSFLIFRIVLGAFPFAEIDRFSQIQRSDWWR